MKSRHCIFILALFSIFSTATPAFSAPLQTGADFEDEFQIAKQNYDNSKWAAAIEHLQKCLAAPELSDNQKMQAWRLLAHTYLAEKLENQAKEAIRSLLEIVPDYSPDPVDDKPSFAKLVEIEKQKIIEEQKISASIPADSSAAFTAPSDNGKKHKKKWYIIGGVGLVATGTVLYLVTRPKEEQDLPMPPSLP